MILNFLFLSNMILNFLFLSNMIFHFFFLARIIGISLLFKWECLFWLMVRQSKSDLRYIFQADISELFIVIYAWQVWTNLFFIAVFSYLPYDQLVGFLLLFRSTAGEFMIENNFSLIERRSCTPISVQTIINNLSIFVFIQIFNWLSPNLIIANSSVTNSLFIHLLASIYWKPVLKY
jgi:hypothetical protein